MSIVSFLSELDRVSDALGAHLRRLRGEEQKRAATAGILWGARFMGWPVSVVRRERRFSQPWLKTVAEIRDCDRGE
ncbi:hypothetical protein HMPREF2836_04755 [Rothia sp. HMSC065C12]|nr:hypothetical protein HMPREF2842_05410 [Rothia sp. HMSC069C10]OFJ99295.1 hypothetical protein HMPREF2836_04755 [Rothia sp. HMSC065C12]OFR47324.1 hypothetical protein HMPREF2884_07210 [Rothia sp. HMSC073B08]